MGTIVISKSSKMQIFIQGSTTSTYDVTPVMTIADLKEIISIRESLPTDNQVLCLHGHPLSDNQTLFDVAPLSTISLGTRMLGGKVHGSLARAGKVKGQTPKVEAEEKKKKKTGRAKRRDQYNKRFVNVVDIPGMRKKGPNSNEGKQ